jgi:hypothetical protein
VEGLAITIEVSRQLKRACFLHVGQHEGKAYVSTEHPASKEGARISDSNVDKKRPNCAEASPGQGKEAFDSR